MENTTPSTEKIVRLYIAIGIVMNVVIKKIIAKGSFLYARKWVAIPKLI